MWARSSLSLVVGIGGAAAGAAIPVLLGSRAGYRQEWTKVHEVAVTWYSVVPTLDVKIVGTAPANGARIEAGRTIGIGANVQNNMDRDVYAYIHVTVKGVRTGTTYGTFASSVERVYAKTTTQLIATTNFSFPNEDVQATFVLYARLA